MDEAQQTIFEQATGKPYEGHEADWQAVMDLLGLPMSYLVAVQTALQQGRWRAAKNPAAYLRTVAQGEYLKELGPADDFTKKQGLRVPESFRYDEDGHVQPSAAAHDTYIEWLAFRADDDYYDNMETYARQRVSPDLLRPEDEADWRYEVDWPKVAERAGLDVEEREIVLYRVLGYTRDAVLSRLATSADDRLRLQAAWRRLDRDLPKLAAVLRGRPEN